MLADNLTGLEDIKKIAVYSNIWFFLLVKRAYKDIWRLVK